MQHGLLRIVMIKRMAVDTLPIKIFVFNNGCLLERREITLIDAHFMPQFVARINEAIHQKRIDGITRNAVRYGRINHPFASLLHADAKENGLPGSRFQQLVPSRFVDFYCVLSRLHQNLGITSDDANLGLVGLSLAQNFKIRGRNIPRKRHVGIVGIDRQLAFGAHIGLVIA